jgi:hypothetical protein
MMTTRYLRFATALLFAAVPACAANVQTELPEPDNANKLAVDVSKDGGASDAGAADSARSDSASQQESDAAAGLQFTSGPIVPPELPLGFV